MGQRCPNCGWSLVTTYTPPILEDNREYAITLLAGNDVSPAVLKAITPYGLQLHHCEKVGPRGAKGALCRTCF